MYVVCVCHVVCFSSILFKHFVQAFCSTMSRSRPGDQRPPSAEEHSARLAAERKAQAVDALKNIGYNVSHVLGTGKPAAGPTMAGRSALMNMPALTSFNGEELATSAAVFKGRAKAHELREQIPKINNPKGGGKAPKDEP